MCGEDAVVRRQAHLGSAQRLQPYELALEAVAEDF